MRRLFKWAAIVLGSLVVLVILAAVAVFLNSNARMGKTYAVALTPVSVPADSASVSSGAHIAVIRGCVDCHGGNLGGQVFFDDPALGLLYASNLTRGRGGVGGSYTDEDWVRAIRHGVGPDGKPLVFMPSQEFYYLSDQDLSALVAYIKSVPPVDHEMPAPRIGPVGRVLLVGGLMPLLPAELIDHEAARPEAPPPGVTVEYGRYLAVGCTGCHGEGYSGGPIPGGPPGTPAPTNITPHETGIGAWSEADFFRALREGKRPDGTEIDPFMPWRLTAQMTDDELRAVYAYLKSLPPTPEGNR